MLYYVMRPDNVNEQFPVFTRYGHLSSDLERAKGRASRCNGRVYCTDANQTQLVADYWTAPVAKSTRQPFHVFQRMSVEAALFGITTNAT
jgi:hypothetical protein